MLPLRTVLIDNSVIVTEPVAGEFRTSHVVDGVEHVVDWWHTDGEAVLGHARSVREITADRLSA